MKIYTFGFAIGAAEAADKVIRQQAVPESESTTGSTETKLAVDGAARLKGLELLFDYTKFHIGLYLTLASVYITIATLRVKDMPLVPLNSYWMWMAIVAFMIAGLAGGIIASSISQWFGDKVNSADSFLKEPTGPSGIGRLLQFTGKKWTQIEHWAFWMGLVFAVLSFAFAKPAILSEFSWSL